ncbi:aspartyl/glutamyl-tRNA(Asn/Gln) amidotransferase subunit C [Rhodoplanes elegans]|uniref:Asp-tRNA(Asn)/Glu-tRNA(Gln) amidotransferase GatCAB subunit C n=1 Tax=Rhodoplanes elegans TaxID=29408 RepID=A0A327KVW4_9BRAD|nr:molybdopterin-dependent oxidoreductase [Rhodoplanes elegans]MBK5960537.1 aspartyl/glutamyl-tRNA(Asn/Gln) amidotransferase subunit C [Rhodoplanes elegans]RAI41853.1 Asp-tRNA(Asn)/Glu-tRNA(Gln) amidotransferase GatCAB subunit C [Rhodoplanes elegans]
MTPAPASRRFPSLCHWGAFTATVENGRLVGCTPFPRDPAPSPMLAALPAMVHSPLRITRPAVREGWREGKPRTGHDAFREISWDEALDLVAGELTRVHAAHGPTAVFGGSYGWSSAGRVHHARTLVRRFLALGGGFVDQIANYSFGAAQTLLPHILGTFQPVTGRATDWPSVISNAKLMIAFGGLALKNSQVGSGGVGAHDTETWLRRARAAGVGFVNVSPVNADAPEFLDAEWIPIRPNTDVVLMLGMAHVLLSEGRHDTTFLERYCAGFDRFADYLVGKTDGTAKTPEWAEEICGVPAQKIRELARRAADVPTYMTATWSLQRAHHGEQPYWALITLAAMLGGIGLPGQGFGFGHGSIHGPGLPRLSLPGPEIPPPPNPAKCAIPVARIADMLLDPGGTYEFNGERLTYPDIRLVYWAGGNPFHHHQDLNRLQRAFQKPETVIVHESWWTPTARHADIVLPATTTLERNDVGGTSRDPFVFAMHKAIAPVGEAKNDIDIFAALAERLGYAEAFTQGRDEMAWCRLVYQGIRDGAAKKGIDLPSFQQFWAEGVIELPAPERDYVLMEEFRADPVAHRLGTPSGKIEITSDVVQRFGYDDAPPHPAWLPPAEWLGATEAQRFPLHLLTNQPVRRLHSQTDPGPVSVAGKILGREAIRLAPDDAAARGLRDGDIVRVFNARGACLAGVVIDSGLAANVAVMPTGAWFDPSPSGDGLDVHGNPNVLTPDIGTSRLTQGSSAQSTLVEVEKFVGALPPIRAFDPPSLARDAAPV